MTKRKDVVRELRTTSKGKTYWYYPESAERLAEKYRQQRAELKKTHKLSKESNQWNSIETTANVIKLDSKTDEHYLRYVQKKKELREEYKTWTRMNRNEWLEYYKRLGDLMFNDEDFQHYFKESKKLFEEKILDEWWEKQKQKEEDYDGRSDEYAW